MIEFDKKHKAGPGLPVILTLIAFSSHAEVYKWVDADGQVHFGDRPRGSAPEKIEIRKNENRLRDRENLQQRIEGINRWNEERDIEREQKKKQKAEDDEKKRQKQQKCSEAKADLAEKERGRTVWYDLDEKGERRYYSDEEIDAYKVKLREFIKRNCR